MLLWAQLGREMQPGLKPLSQWAAKRQGSLPKNTNAYSISTVSRFTQKKASVPNGTFLDALK